MYCQACGSKIPDGRSRCDACGTAVVRAHAPAREPVTLSTTYATPASLPEPISICPRCSFRGQSVGYFSRGTHVAGLVALTVFTAGFLGVGGLGYYLLRREHRICSRCGHSLGKHGVNALALVDGSERLAPRPPLPMVEERSGPGFISWVFFALAAFLTFIGIVEGAPEAVMFALMSAGAGYGLMRHTNSKREARRAALIQSLQQPVLALAGERQGRLTVTEVASSLGWSLPRAEKVLESLEDGLRVASDVTDEGVIVYEFRELMLVSRSAGGTGPRFGAATQAERRLEA